MDYGDSSWGLYRDYPRDPFHHSVRRARQSLSAPCAQAWPWFSEVRAFQRTSRRLAEQHLGEDSTLGALIIRIGFGGIL